MSIWWIVYIIGALATTIWAYRENDERGPIVFLAIGLILGSMWPVTALMIWQNHCWFPDERPAREKPIRAFLVLCALAFLALIENLKRRLHVLGS